MGAEISCGNSTRKLTRWLDRFTHNSTYLMCEAICGLHMNWHDLIRISYEFGKIDGFGNSKRIFSLEYYWNKYYFLIDNSYC